MAEATAALRRRAAPEAALKWSRHDLFLVTYGSYGYRLLLNNLLFNLTPTICCISPLIKFSFFARVY